MRKLSRLLAASVAGLSLAGMASASHAAMVTIWIDDDGPGAHGFTQVGFDPLSTGTASFSGTIGGFVLNLGGSAGTWPVANSQGIDTRSTGSGDLDIIVSVQGLTAPLGDRSWLSTFQTQPLSQGWTLTERTFLSASNQALSGVLLASATMTANFLPQQAFSFAEAATGAGPYAINTEYVLHAAGAGSANSTISVFNNGIIERPGVPEPATWGLMILGFGGVGSLLRQRRRQAALA